MIPALHPKLSVCVLSYQGQDILKRCLQSILRQTGSFSLELLVTDNGSTDGTSEMVAQEFPTAQLIVNPTNQPFTLAFNTMIRRSTGRWIAVVSNDIEFIEPNSLEVMTRCLRENPRYAAVAPRQVKPDGTLDAICKKEIGFYELLADWTLIGRFSQLVMPSRDRLYSAAELDRSKEVEVVQDSCLVLRRDALELETEGLYDERFVMYYTEDDICVRFRRRGFAVFYAGELEVAHRHRHATKQSRKIWVEWVYLKDAIHYSAKFLGRIKTVTLLAPLACLTFLVRISFWTVTGKLRWN